MKILIPFFICVLLGTGSLAQNDAFHKDMTDVNKSIDKIESEIDDIEKLMKKAEKAVNIKVAHENFEKASELLDDALDRERKLQKALRAAEKSAKDYGCKKTVDLVEEAAKTMDSTIAEIEEARKLAIKGATTKKLKKIGKPVGALKVAMKAVYKEMEMLKNKVAVADASCT